MIKGRTLKIVAVKLLIVFTFQVFTPNISLALTGGPTQPEVNSFEPIGTTQMVDLYSGDFNYNIPLMNVPGSNGSYPINIAYHAGIGMEQEATWVGLGWNINPGAIVRQMRGLPDDFDGDGLESDIVDQEYTIKKDFTIGVNAGSNTEVVGAKLVSNIGGSAGLYYNSYRGIGYSLGVNLSSSMRSSTGGGENSGMGFKGGLGLNYDSQGGMNAQPNIGLSNIAAGKKRENTIGLSLSSTQGLKEISFSRNTFKGKANGGWSAVKNRGAGFSLSHPGYIPGITSPMRTTSFTVGVNFGSEATVVETSYDVNVNYTETAVKQKSRSVRAYGLLNLEGAIGKDDAIMDFNREKDGPISDESPYTPIPIRTNDVYEIQGQGTGGAFRAFRSDIGYLTDVKNTSNGTATTVKFETDAGVGVQLGADFSFGYSESYSGPWKNNSFSQLEKYKSTDGTDQNNPLYEKFYFKSNGELTATDLDQLDGIGGEKAIAFELGRAIEGLCIKPFAKNAVNGSHVNYKNRTTREKRNQHIEYLTKGELLTLGKTVSATGASHHIHQMSVTNADGNKYTYGLPAYNLFQEEVTFSVNEIAGNGNTKLVPYTANVDNSLGNDKGEDNYYSLTRLPAYAHSYMLTAIEANDYVDLKNDGPTDDDFGFWTKFDYTKVNNYKWRFPYEANKANYSRGSYSNSEDDKGSYVYGAKNLNYLEKVETNTHFAIFELENRNDGVSVSGKNGGQGTVKQKLLRSITLYSKADPSTPIKKVHFEYDYSLCKGNPSNLNPTKGKLTLKKIYFTHLNNAKGSLTPYEFEYNINPDYKTMNVDRWGNYQPDAGSFKNYVENPYTRQDNAHANRDNNASAWCLNKINLPSGSSINVAYEADDYLYVQNKDAMQMFEIVGTSDITSTTINSAKPLSLDERRIYFKTHKTLTNDADVKAYISGVKDLYFKTFLSVKKINGTDQNDYVTGYAPINLTSGYGMTNDSTGYFTLESVTYNGKKKGVFYANPIQLAGWRYLRYQRPDLTMKLNSGLGLITSNLVKIMEEAATLLTGYYNKCRLLQYSNKIISSVPQKSYVRLNSIGQKYGGGHRVKSIKIGSSWEGVAEEFGQEYAYEQRNGTSSGVAEYEPMTGGDEISLRLPKYFNKKDNIIMSHRDFKIEPYGESFFPGAKVGYSRVVVTNLKDDNITYAQTGVSVNEFYTSKEFPVIVRLAQKTPINKPTNIPGFYVPFVGSHNIQTNGYSNGYSIIINDMPGKPKLVATYPYGSDLAANPVSKTEYQYHTKSSTDKDGTPILELNNEVTVLTAHGQTKQAKIGETYDFYIDQTEHSSFSATIGVEANLILATVPPLAPVPIFTAFPDFESSQALYRHVITNKVIFRNGIMKSVTNETDGAIVVAKNEVFDAEPGQVLLTSSDNEYKKSIYNYSYPAHWAYSNMKGAYKNYRASFKVVPAVNGYTISGVPDITDYVNLGDQIAKNAYSNFGWVTNIDKANNSFQVKDISNNPISYTTTNTLMVMISGNTNMQSVSNGNIVSFENPVNFVSSMNFLKSVFHNINIGNVIPNYTPINLLNPCNDKTLSGIEFLLDNCFRIHYPNTECEYYLDPQVTPPFSQTNSTVFDLNSIEIIGDKLMVKASDGSQTGTFTYTMPTDENCKICVDFPILQASATEFCDTCWTYNYADVGNPQIKVGTGVTALNGANVNPYRFGQRGIWRVLRSWAYQEARKQSGSNGNETRIDKDGQFDFRPFSWMDGKKGNANWTWASEITQYSPYGFQLENRNPLNIFSSEMYGYNNTVVTAVGSNAQYEEIAFDGFEDYGYNTTASGLPAYLGSGKHGHFNFSNNISVRSTHAHTGKHALEVEAYGNATYSLTPSYFTPKTNKSYVLSAWVYSRGVSGTIEVEVNGTVYNGQVSSQFQEIDGWSKIEIEFDIPASLTSFHVKLKSGWDGSDGHDAYFDDLRISPFNGGMKTYVYDPATLWLMAELDNLNYATFYNYDEEGSLVQVKKETNQGIVTIKSTRNNTAQ